MKKFLSVVLLFLLASFAAVSTASAVTCDSDIDVDLSCPTSVPTGSGFSVSVTVCNNEGSTATLTRGMVGLIGNAGGTLGGAGIYGPFNKPLSWSVPAYGCIYNKSVSVLNTVPASLGGKIAAVMFGIWTSKGCVIESDGCLVQVTP